MINILLLASLCFTIGMFVPVVFGLTMEMWWVPQIICGAALCIWSIGCFVGGMIATTRYLDIAKISDDKNGKNT